MNAPNFNNPATRRERAEIVREERKLRRGDRDATTYHRLAGLADDLGGRFAVEAGEEKATDYPKQPAGSWSEQPGPGVEPPTGIEIDAQDPTGEFHEIEASLATSSNPAHSQKVRSAGVEGDDVAGEHCSSGSAEGDAPLPSAKREAANHLTPEAGGSAPASNSRAVPSTHVPGHPPIKRRKVR